MTIGVRQIDHKKEKKPNNPQGEILLGEIGIKRFQLFVDKFFQTKLNHSYQFQGSFEPQISKQKQQQTENVSGNLSKKKK